MNPNNNKALPCSVFGHNYVKSKTHNDSTTELQCCHCDVIVNTDDKGNFDSSCISNTHIQSALRQLFHLRLRTLKPSYTP